MPSIGEEPLIQKKNILQLLNENIEKPIIIIGLLGSIFLISYQCLGRYILLKLFPDMIMPAWTEESARFLFIWSTYSAIPLTIRLRQNIRVDVIYDRLPPSLQGMTWIMVSTLNTHQR
jgi:C4-dicarboxylate transporter DctM subunit